MVKKADVDDETWNLIFAYQQWYKEKFGFDLKIRSVLKYAMKFLIGVKKIPVKGENDNAKSRLP